MINNVSACLLDMAFAMEARHKDLVKVQDEDCFTASNLALQALVIYAGQIRALAKLMDQDMERESQRFIEMLCQELARTPLSVRACRSDLVDDYK